MSSPTDDPLFIDLGARVKTLRSKRRLSQRKLAKLSDLSPATISLIERNEISPSASTLIRLSKALRVHITALFDPDHSHPVDLHHVSVANRRYLHFASVKVEDLGAGGVENAPVVPYLLTLDPGAESGQLGMLGGQAFIYCLEGTITVTFEQQTCVLAEGDSLLFAMNKAHHWSNPSIGASRILVVMCNIVHLGDALTNYLGTPPL